MKWVAAGLMAGTVMMTAGAPAALAQAGSTSTTQAEAADPNAGEVRAEFMEVLSRYPADVARVFRLDPTLLSREDYLAQYPAVAEFLKRHPEVRHSPAYYLERVSYPSSYTRQPFDNMFEFIAIVLVTFAIVGGIIWLIRTAVDYRRWGRLAKVQAEAHTKLLDRFTGNDELLAYIQSPAGTRFLQSAPITLDGEGPRPVAAPLNRILWSMQAGVVLAIAGVGMQYMANRLEAGYIARGYQAGSADEFLVLAVTATAIGVGFIVSAGLSYLLSKRLGLFGSEPGAGA